MSDVTFSTFVPGLGEWLSPIEQLRRDGIVLAPALSQPDVAETVAYLQQSAVFDAHVEAKATRRESFQRAIAERWPMFCSSLASVVCAPHLFEVAVEMLPLARKYFDGEEPLIYSMNAFWTQPSHLPPYQDTHGWHRDGDDRKQLVLFAYGTNVLGDDDGAHLYQRGSQDVPDEQLDRDFRSPPDSVVAHIHGLRGTMFLSDTRGLHVGLRPQTGLRMLLWARFGVSDPPISYVHDRLAPVSAASLGSRYHRLTGEQRRAIRLIAA